MAKEQGSKTTLIIVAVILGFVLLGGIIFGISCYYIYKIGSQEQTTSTTKTDDWLPIVNTRYGFSLKYPKTFTASVPVNGDGVSLTLKSPAISINAFGAANSQNLSLDAYLNTARAYVFKGVEGASEISAKDTTLGGVAAQERIWQYTNPNDGSETIMDQVTATKDGNLYTIAMVIANSDYSQYAPMFVQILGTYQFK